MHIERERLCTPTRERKNQFHRVDKKKNNTNKSNKKAFFSATHLTE